ncbi:hypothetical protein CBW46_017720 [Paenibacillus xerothermodurans]|uniref:Uncharacterized protein n=1 Tax=Paenibacillus xerothermodurans TaxID=1977292 RepID=A0A2W1NXH3_PAEXE|nr:hypothetical protein CBW46_017720 [Paenibacillus xerothermodurans]
MHQQARNHAYNEAGISAVPTLTIGQQVVKGIQSAQTLEKIIQQQSNK